MKTSTTRKRRPKGLISVGVVLTAIAISLMMQGAAQAWWGVTWLVYGRSLLGPTGRAMRVF